LVADAESLGDTLAARSGDGRVPQFDLVWSFGVIHHTPSPAAAVRELARLVKPGGELRLMVYAKVSYKLFFLMRETGVWDFARIDELLGEYSEAQSGCPVTYSYTEARGARHAAAGERVGGGVGGEGPHFCVQHSRVSTSISTCARRAGPTCPRTSFANSNASSAGTCWCARNDDKRRKK
jgi:SAM-dependent methyltransferase